MERFTFTDRAHPLVHLGIGDRRVDTGNARWDVSRWDQAGSEWGANRPLWRNVSCDVESAEWEYGRPSSTDRFVVGTATIIARNDTGWADPDVVEDPGVLTMRPGRPVRIGVWHETLGFCWRFYGFVDAIRPTYDADGVDLVQIDCIDALGEANRPKLVPLAVPVGEQQAHVRVARILDEAFWPTDARDIQVSSTFLLPSDLGGQVADLLGVVAESVGGAVFGDLDGNVVFRHRDWQVFQGGMPPDGVIGNVDADRVVFLDEPVPLVEDPAGSDLFTIDGVSLVEDPAGSELYRTVGATLAEHPGVAGLYLAVAPGTVSVLRPGDVCPVAWARPFDRADMATRVNLRRADPPGTEVPTPWVQRDDIEGRALYGVEPFERTYLLTRDAAALGVLADRIMATRDWRYTPRVRAVTLDAASAQDALDLMATVDVYKPSRYRCRLALDRGPIFDAEYLATAVRHRITPDEWTLQLSLDNAAPWAIDGAPSAARWDGAVWNTGTWTTASPAA